MVDVVICFECLSLDTYGPGEAQGGATISSAPGRELTALFEAHGLTIHTND